MPLSDQLFVFLEDNVKRLICVLVTLMLLIPLGLTACNGSGNEGEQTTTTVQTPGENAPLTVDLTVAGNPLSEYKIVFARSEYYVQGPKAFTTEWDFYKLIAYHVRDQIYNLTGVALEMSRDTSTDLTDKEILVGPTNRAESDAYDSLDVYTCQSFVKNGKLMIGGGYDASYLSGNLKTAYSWGASYHAFDYIIEYIQGQVNSTNTAVDLAEGFELKDKCELKTVACVGDSITEGDKATDWNVTSWPPVLQRYLWQDYVIVNYGKCGKTMRNNMDRRYNTCDQFKAASKYQEQFDLALIMLGTNDFLNDGSFSASDDKNFEDSALEIVEMLTKNNKDMKITLMNCPAYYGSNTASFKHVRDIQYELYGTLRKKGYDTCFFDMYTFTDKTLTASRYPDKLHPNDSGYALIAEKLSTVVPAVMSGSWDSDEQEVRPAEMSTLAVLPTKAYEYPFSKKNNRIA